MLAAPSQRARARQAGSLLHLFQVLTALLTWQLRAELAATSSAELVATSVPYLTLP
ncbi:hypothetical protein ABBQ32_008047 [Trebouxia sp. C0010 RCD-2024]